jgi:hypothetical protein
MAQSIVLEHRGSIVVESRPGNRAVSRVEWPMVAAQVQGRLPAERFEVTALAVAGGNARFNCLEPTSLRQFGLQS